MPTQQKRLREQSSGLGNGKPGQSLLVPIADPQVSKAIRQAPGQPGQHQSLKQQPASTQYAGHSAGLHDESNPYAPSDDDTKYSTRMPTSARVYGAKSTVVRQGNKEFVVHSAIPPRKTASHKRASAEEDRDTDDLPKRRRVPWYVLVVLLFFVMILGWIGFTALANWWQVTQDDWHYGRPRTFQIDAVVGHNDGPDNPSHFVAVNLHSRVEIIELPGGDSSKARIYSGPTLVGDNSDLIPVSLTFTDVDRDGTPDMIVNARNEHVVYLNQSGKFVPQQQT